MFVDVAIAMNITKRNEGKRNSRKEEEGKAR